MVKMERGRPCCADRGVFQLHICSLLSIVRLSHSPGTRPAVRATASCVTSAEDSGTSTRYAYALRTSGVCKITDDKTNKTPDQQWGPRRMLLDPLKQKGVGAYQFVTRGLGWDRCGCQSSFPALQTNLESRRRNDVKRPESLIFRCNKWRIVQSIQELDSDADFAFASSWVFLGGEASKFSSFHVPPFLSFLWRNKLTIKICYSFSLSPSWRSDEKLQMISGWNIEVGDNVQPANSWCSQHK